MSTLERVNEACRLRAFMPNNREFVVSMADIFGCHPLKADGDALYHFLEPFTTMAGLRASGRSANTRRRLLHE